MNLQDLQSRWNTGSICLGGRNTPLGRVILWILIFWINPYLYTYTFFPIPLLYSPFYSLSLLVVTQIRGHMAGSSPPLPSTVRALHFYREKISSLSSLVDPRRIVLTHARRSQLLLPSISSTDS